MEITRLSRTIFAVSAAVALVLNLAACAGSPGADSQSPVPGGGAIDTRTNTLPGSVMPSVGGAGNGGGVSGGGAGAGSFGGGR